MKMFSDCSGSCEECTIHYTGGCIAGHGDDDFQQITEARARRIIAQKQEYLTRGHIVKCLKEVSLEEYKEYYDKNYRKDDERAIKELMNKFPNLKKEQK